VPRREVDDHSITPRNSPSIVDVVAAASATALLHFDGHFASAESLVKETFLGRNFGWLPSERAEAIQHFARVIREDDGSDAGATITGGLSYSTLLRGTDPAIPAELRLPPELRCEVDRATDEAIVDASARLVVAFMRTLQFSRDAEGAPNGSPYDAFLAANRLPRAPAPTQSAAEYGRRLGEQVAALRVPRFVDEPARALRLHAGQPFRFGELELHGMRIFFRSAIGAEQKTGAGNCAECHVPPHFTDFNFHNTGAAQDEYDAIHGPGAFGRLRVPDLATRNAHFNRWLPATPHHVDADGPFLKVPDAGDPDKTDLGVWNVYGNPDLPDPQPALERLLNPGGGLSSDEVLSRAFARFKTSSLRNLGESAPYLHTGQLQSIEDTIIFYQRMSEIARNGRLRNAPPEYFTMRIGTEDVAPLAAFLRALNEDFDASLRMFPARRERTSSSRQ
jgi:cytochrome c peroxidase